MMGCAVVAVLMSWNDEGLCQCPFKLRCQNVTCDWVSHLGRGVARVAPQGVNRDSGDQAAKSDLADLDRAPPPHGLP